MTSPFYDHARQSCDQSLEVEQLLMRYPRINPSELKTLIALLPELSIIDMAMVTADERLSEPLAAFHRDHGHIFNAPVKTLVLMLALPFAAVGMLWWIVS